MLSTVVYNLETRAALFETAACDNVTIEHIPIVMETEPAFDALENVHHPSVIRVAVDVRDDVQVVVAVIR